MGGNRILKEIQLSWGNSMYRCDSVSVHAIYRYLKSKKTGILGFRSTAVWPQMNKEYSMMHGCAALQLIISI